MQSYYPDLALEAPRVPRRRVKIGGRIAQNRLSHQNSSTGIPAGTYQNLTSPKSHFIALDPSVCRLYVQYIIQGYMSGCESAHDATSTSSLALLLRQDEPFTNPFFLLSGIRHGVPGSNPTNDTHLKKMLTNNNGPINAEQQLCTHPRNRRGKSITSFDKKSYQNSKLQHLEIKIIGATFVINQLIAE